MAVAPVVQAAQRGRADGSRRAWASQRGNSSARRPAAPVAGARPKGPGSAALGTRREHDKEGAFLAWAPGPIPECFEAADLEAAPVPSGLRAQLPPVLLTPSGCEVRGSLRFSDPQLG